MSDLLQDTDLKREVAKEPSKRWRNKWYVLSAFRAAGWGFDVEPGERWGPRSYQTKDAAETDAHKTTTENPSVVWLGAFPDGEAP